MGNGGRKDSDNTWINPEALLASAGKNLPGQCRRCWRHRLDPGLGRSTGGGNGTHSSMCLPGESLTEETGRLWPIGNKESAMTSEACL